MLLLLPLPLLLTPAPAIGRRGCVPGAAPGQWRPCCGLPEPVAILCDPARCMIDALHALGEAAIKINAPLKDSIGHSSTDAKCSVYTDNYDEERSILAARLATCTTVCSVLRVVRREKRRRRRRRTQARAVDEADACACPSPSKEKPPPLAHSKPPLSLFSNTLCHEGRIIIVISAWSRKKAWGSYFSSCRRGGDRREEGRRPKSINQEEIRTTGRARS